MPSSDGIAFFVVIIYNCINGVCIIYFIRLRVQWDLEGAVMELQERIDALDLWDEMPYSLEIKDFGNTVILVSESAEIRFINCVEISIKSSLLVKNKSMKFHNYRNHEYDVQDISVEPCVVTIDGTMTHNKKWVSPVLNGVKAKIVMPVMCIDLIAVDFIISTKKDEENLIQSKFSYIDLE